MEIIGDKQGTVEVHVKLTRRELEDIISDMDSDTTRKDPYVVTEEFLSYLKRL